MTQAPAAAPEWDLQEARRIVLEGLHGVPARVYLIGSRARGTAGRYSDIDIAILPERPLPVGTLAAIRETLEDSDILYAVDIVNLEDVSGEFRERAIKEGVPWND